MFYDTGWSAQARLLPYMEGNPLFNAANISVFKEDPVNSTVISLTVSAFICPSEIKPEPSDARLWYLRGDQLRDERRRLVRLGRIQRAAEPLGLRPQPEPPSRGVHRRPEPDLVRRRGKGLSDLVELPLHHAAVGKQPQQHPEPVRGPLHGRTRIRQRRCASPRTSTSSTPSGPTAMSTPPGSRRPGRPTR